jgi:hypothetical protein
MKTQFAPLSYLAAYFEPQLIIPALQAFVWVEMRASG